MLVTSTLGIAMIALILILASQRFLLPAIIMIGSFICFVLWLTGLIETALQLYGVAGSVNDKCGYWVEGNGIRGDKDGIEALAWLTQITICEFAFSPCVLWIDCVGWGGEWLMVHVGNCWKTAFAFELVNTIFFLWMIVMAWRVSRNVYD